MQVSEIINIIGKELMTFIPFEPQKYRDLLKGSVTGNRYFSDDRIISLCDISELRNICSYIIHGDMLSNIVLSFTNQKFMIISDKVSDHIELFFEETNLDTNKTAQLVKNFDKLEKWAEKTFNELDKYSMNSALLKDDLKKILKITFSEDISILKEVLKNPNIFTTNEQKQQALDIISNLGQFRDKHYDELDDLIAEQIAIKISDNVDKLNYQWYKKITNQELQIQKYDELKQNDVFQKLF